MKKLGILVEVSHFSITSQAGFVEQLIIIYRDTSLCLHLIYGMIKGENQ